MATSGDVILTIADGGATIAVPAANLQFVLGCCDSGTAYDILATRQTSTLLSTFGYGPLSEAGGMAIRDGATLLAMRIPTTTAGAIAKKTATAVSGATAATPVVVTTTTPHGLIDGDVVTTASIGGTTGANGTFIVDVLSTTTFSLVNSVGGGAYTSGGTVTPAGSIQSGSGTSVVTFTGTPKDTAYILVTIVTGGTIGATGIQFTVSLDAGRSVNLPVIALGTATTYVIPNIGVTINFAAGTLTAGVTIRGYTTEPLPAIADITAGILAMQNSVYGSAGFGSSHLLGALAAADAATVGSNLETMATAQIYTRMMAHARDATAPAAWGGGGETDSAWGTSLLADYFSTTSKRLGVSAGHYNMRSVFPNSACGLPLYRRPLSWAVAARVAGQLPLPADHEGWVRLGAMSQITQDNTTDPLDGFVYHDERKGFVFDNLAGGAGRMTCARTRVGKRGAGWWVSNPLSLAAVGSDFQLMPRGRVMDIVSDTIQQAASPSINERVKLNPNGTIRETSALRMEATQRRAIDVAVGNQISGRTIVVDRDYNVRANSKLRITGQIEGDGYVLQIDETIGYAP
jgi:hypothetical protein